MSFYPCRASGVGNRMTSHPLAVRCTVGSEDPGSHPSLSMGTCHCKAWWDPSSTGLANSGYATGVSYALHTMTREGE